MHIIRSLSYRHIQKVINTGKPFGLFYHKQPDGLCTAVKNLDGQPRIKFNLTHREVYKYLNE